MDLQGKTLGTKQVTSESPSQHPQRSIVQFQTVQTPKMLWKLSEKELEKKKPQKIMNRKQCHTIPDPTLNKKKARLTLPLDN